MGGRSRRSDRQGVDARRRSCRPDRTSTWTELVPRSSDAVVVSVDHGLALAVGAAISVVCQTTVDHQADRCAGPAWSARHIGVADGQRGTPRRRAQDAPGCAGALLEVAHVSGAALVPGLGLS